ncbi:hypothetical protein DMA11_20485 [Marinilabiliaceae bacterium JC017]|nr:hypothetical protein DMA11_20485 [Marinilabiliaceae bacterium JC017]
MKNHISLLCKLKAILLAISMLYSCAGYRTIEIPDYSSHLREETMLYMKHKTDFYRLKEWRNDSTHLRVIATPIRSTKVKSDPTAMVLHVEQLHIIEAHPHYQVIHIPHDAIEKLVNYEFSEGRALVNSLTLVGSFLGIMFLFAFISYSQHDSIGGIGF